MSPRARPVLRSRQISDLSAVATEKMQAPSQEQCRNQEISAWRHGCVWRLRGTPAGGVVKENILYVSANGTVTKKPSCLRKKGTFGSRESLYKCCDRKTAGSTQLAKEST
ncbi:uncharacterized protein LOC117065071 [Trachypithecus francoisi]|uniref:uncharacterized protein LOC117065071 n=1 Tax=Trachypithecus francoisi TaxID=54180 RepID=UPI00141AD7ED|nr:uncharacterized protein LOC117065071 [Trachypithecus francoisi]